MWSSNEQRRMHVQLFLFSSDSSLPPSHQRRPGASQVHALAVPLAVPALLPSLPALFPGDHAPLIQNPVGPSVAAARCTASRGPLLAAGGGSILSAELVSQGLVSQNSAPPKPSSPGSRLQKMARLSLLPHAQLARAVCCRAAWRGC